MRSCIICTLPNPAGDWVEEDVMYSTLGRNKCIQNCSLTCEGETPLGGSKNKGQNNINSELKEQTCKDILQWRDFVGTVLNFRFPELSGNFSLSRRVVFCGVGCHLILCPIVSISPSSLLWYL
jgi:hypothetical protein